MVLCAFQCDSTCLARQRRGQRIDRSRHIRAGDKINLFHYEPAEEATEPEASAIIVGNRNPLFYQYLVALW